MSDDSEAEGPAETAGAPAGILEAALAEIHHDLLHFARRRLGNDHDAADAVQEFYVKVFTHFSGLRDSDKIRPWMARILKNVIADHFRRKGRQQKLVGELGAEGASELPAIDEEIDLIVCNCLYKLLPTLNEDYARLIWRADLLGEDRAVIAGDLGLSEGAFRVKLHRARQALRRRLEETCEACPEHGFFNCGCCYSKTLQKAVSTVSSDPVGRP